MTFQVAIDLKKGRFSYDFTCKKKFSSRIVVIDKFYLMRIEYICSVDCNTDQA